MVRTIQLGLDQTRAGKLNSHDTFRGIFSIMFFHACTCSLYPDSLYTGSYRSFSMEYKILVTTYDKDRLTKMGAGWLHHPRDLGGEESILVDISKELNLVAKGGWRVKQYNNIRLG